MTVSRRILFFAGIGLLVLALDQLTKWLIIQAMPLNTSQAPFPSLYPYFQLSHVSNTGMAFGFLPQAKWILTVLVIGVTLGLATLNYIEPSASLKLRIALGLLFGGALGNLVDRFRIGHVTDFLNFNLRPLLQPVIDIPILDWPVFNVADMAVSAGILLLVLYLLLDQEPEEQANPQEQR